MDVWNAVMLWIAAGLAYTFFLIGYGIMSDEVDFTSEDVDAGSVILLVLLGPLTPLYWALDATVGALLRGRENDEDDEWPNPPAAT